MEINFTLTKKDYKKIFKKYLSTSEMSKEPFFNYRTSLLFFSFIILAIFSQNLVSNFIIFFTLICIIILRNKLAFLSNFFALNSMMRRYNFLFFNSHIVISEEGIKITMENYEEIIYWNGIENLYYIEEYILIKTYFSNEILIPAKSFSSIPLKYKFIELVENYTNLIPLNYYPKIYIPFYI